MLLVEVVQGLRCGAQAAEQLDAGDAGQALALALLIAFPERQLRPVGHDYHARRP